MYLKIEKKLNFYLGAVSLCIISVNGNLIWTDLSAWSDSVL